MKTGFSVMDAMTKHPVTIAKNTLVIDCAKKMEEFNIGSIIVKEGDYIAGILTEEDIVRRVVAQRKDPLIVRVEDVMSRSVVTTSADADIYDALVAMRDGNIRHLPVTDGKELLGFLTMKDILKIEPDLLDLMVEHMDVREVGHQQIIGTRDLGEEITDVADEEYEAFGGDDSVTPVVAGLDEEERIV